MKKVSRPQFSQEERATPELKKPIKKAEQSAKKADKAQTRIPKKPAVKRTLDKETGKVKTKLIFEDKKPPSKLLHDIRAAPLEISTQTFRRNVQTNADETSVSSDVASSAESLHNAVARFTASSIRNAQLRPYRSAARAERSLEKAYLNVLYQKAQREQPAASPLSRFMQRRAIRLEYAAAATGQSAQTPAKAAQTVKRAAKKTAQFVRKHNRSFLAVIMILLLLSFLSSFLSSCSVIIESFIAPIAASTYPSRDEDMLGAEAEYIEKEQELQSYLDNYTRTHDYDEYHFEVDEIGHDPYVLISLLTAWMQGEWTLDEVEDQLQTLFERQYILTETVTVETRTDDDGEDYDYTICTVTLENIGLDHLPVYFLDEEQLSMYALYMSTLGNRPDLFEDSEYIGRYGTGSYTNYDVPEDALADETFAAMLEEAEKYLGYPYVWGGSSPETSFDCSGFVCWVVNHSGWNVGRTTAQGLYNLCTPVSNPRPGDLVFFQGTYKTSDTVTHVGIYVGNGWMIHCGDPISYIEISGSYYASHFYAYGRLPHQ